MAKNQTKLPTIPLKIGVATHFNKLGRGSLKEHPHKILNKSMQRFNRRSRKTKKVYADDEADNRHRVIARDCQTLSETNNSDRLIITTHIPLKS